MRFCITLAVLVSASALHADVWNKSFVMKNNEPVIAGNKVLNPGSHVWKLLSSESNRHIVQITNQRTGAVETTILAIPSYRSTPVTKNLVQFWETPKGYPQAVRSWFYPGDNYGQEFVYPRRMLAAWRPFARPHRSYPQSAGNEVGQESETHKQLQAVHTKGGAQSGSWAVIDGSAAANKRAKSNDKRMADSKAVNGHESNGFWDALKRLPKTATLAPLIGLIGIVSLALWLFSYLKRKNRKLYTVGDDSP